MERSGRHHRSPSAAAIGAQRFAAGNGAHL